jgi:hypothetical protein
MARKLSAYNKFVKRYAKKGFSMAKIADLWRKSGKGKFKSKLPKTTKRRASTTRKKIIRRKKTMPKRKYTKRRRSNPMGSYSKSNIAGGALMASVAPKLLPQVASYLPLAALLPKAPTALKVMGWTLASKIISDRYLGR